MYPILALLLACQSPPAEAPAVTRAPAKADQPDLLLFLTSGLRADAPGQAGAEAAFIQGLSQSPQTTPSRRYTAAYAQSAAAFVSMGSLLSGRYATSLPLCGLFTTGVKGVMSAHVQPNAVEDRAWCAQVPKDTHTMAEVLGLYGYETALFSVGLTGIQLVSPGFGHAEVVAEAKEGGTDWAALEANVGAWWDTHAKAPRFLVVQTSDMQVTERAELQARMGVNLQLEGAVALGKDSWASADSNQTMTVYAQEAQKVGAQFSALMTRLKHTRPTWGVVSSTNGVSLLESQGFADMPVPFVTTSYSLDRTTHVPLLLYSPEASPLQTQEQLVELLDIFPTFSQLAGALAPANLSGHSLLSQDTDPANWAYAEFGDTLLLRVQNMELIFRGFLHHGTMIDPQMDERLKDPRSAQDPKFFTLHDVSIDPYQEKNLRFTQADAFNHLLQQMITIRSGPAASPKEIWQDPRRLWEVRMARSQGYW